VEISLFVAGKYRTSDKHAIENLPKNQEVNPANTGNVVKARVVNQHGFSSSPHRSWHQGWGNGFRPFATLGFDIFFKAKNMWWLHFKTIKWLLDDGVVRNKGCCGPLGGIHVLNLIHFYGQGLRYKIPIWCIILAWPILDTSVYSPKEVVWGWGISQSSTIFVASWTFGIHWKIIKISPSIDGNA